MLEGLTHSRSPWPASPPFSVFSFRCLHHSRSRLWNTWKTLTFSTLDFVPPEEQKNPMVTYGWWMLMGFLMLLDGFCGFFLVLIFFCLFWSVLVGCWGVLMVLVGFWWAKSYRNDFCAWYKPPNATHQELAETKIIQNKQQRVLGSNCWVFWPWHVGPWQWSRYNPRHTWADLSMENLAGLWGQDCMGVYLQVVVWCECV